MAVDEILLEELNLFISIQSIHKPYSLCSRNINLSSIKDITFYTGCYRNCLRQLKKEGVDIFVPSKLK